MSGAYVGITQSLKTLLRIGENHAGNLARSEVAGAQATRLSVSAAASDAGGHGIGGSALSITQSTRDLSQGALITSDSPTHLALQGEGQFLLFDRSGSLFLSRNGQFDFNQAGELVNPQGLFVASFDPGTNQINKTTKNTASAGGSAEDHIAFDASGQLVNLSRGNAPGRQLALASVPNDQGLAASQTFPGMLTASESSGAIAVGRAGEKGLGTIASQALEASNASMPEELTNLAVFQRNFTATTAALKVLSSAIDDIISQFAPR